MNGVYAGMCGGYPEAMGACLLRGGTRGMREEREMSVPVTRKVRSGSLRLLVVVAMLSAFIAVPAPAMAAWTTTVEVEPNGTPAEANAVLLDGSIAEASISPAGDEDYFKFDLTAGTNYVIENGPSTTALGTNFDIVMWLYDTDGFTPLDYDDDGGAANFSHMTFTPSLTGTYYVKIRAYSHPGSTGIYGFRVREAGVLPGMGTATVSGVVEDEDGPVEGVEAQDYLLDPWFGMVDSGYYELGPVATTDADGAYEITVAEGSHIINFAAGSAYYDNWFNNQLYRDDADIFDLVADDTTTTIDALLEKIPPVETRVLTSQRASEDVDGEGFDSGSRTADISADGRYAVFFSGAALVPEDENGERDWYRKDMTTGEVELVSLSSDGDQANASYSEEDGKASISADGRFVAFDSIATNLVADDMNVAWDVFVRDMDEDTTVRVSVDSDGFEDTGGSWDPAISGDGRFVSFTTDAEFDETDSSEYRDVYVHDLETGDTVRVSVDEEGNEGSRGSRSPAISYDGQFIAFITGNAFVTGDEGGYQDVYVKDMTEGTYRRANVASDGTEADRASWDTPAISDDGSRVVFDSEATNLVADDTNEGLDIFLHDFNTEETTRVSVRSDGSETWSSKHDPAISGDGRMIAFTEDTGSMNRAPSFDAKKADGAVALEHDELPATHGMVSPAEVPIYDTLVDGDTNNQNDVIVHDTADASTTMGSVSAAGTPTDDNSQKPALSLNGRFLGFDSWSDTIDVDDDNGRRDVFVATVEIAAQQPVDGPDRFETAIQVSQDIWPEGSDSVVIATGLNWPDALGGSALAGMAGGPVLLTDPEALLPEVAAEIERLTPGQIYVLGETEAISADVFADIEALTGGDAEVTRLGGVDRYETAEMVADEVIALQTDGYDGTAFVATGENFADALAASPLAAANGWPVYLAPHPVISEQTIDAMQNAGVTDCILLGGDAAMPEDTNVVILAAGFDAVRIDGADRYETASKVAAFGVSDAGLAWNDVAIATGQTFPDALAGGAAQGMLGSVMLLVTKTEVPAYTADALVDNRLSIANVRFLGGMSAVSQAVRDEIHHMMH